MFKRAKWLVTGAAVGFGGSVWLQKKLKTTADRYRPVEVAGAAAARARDALEEGRAVMREREAELRGRAGNRRADKPSHGAFPPGASTPGSSEQRGPLPRSRP